MPESARVPAARPQRTDASDSAISASDAAPAPRALAIATIAALTIVQLWGLTRYFPISSWFNRRPFYTSSYALHFARSLMSASSMARHFRLWSYSPYLMAGYPAGTRTEPMGDAVALWFWLWSAFWKFNSIGRAAILFKMFVIGCLVSIPAVAAATALWLGFDWTVAAIAAGLGVFGTFNFPGLLMIRAGMFSFFTACFLCVAWSALLYDSRDRGTPRLAAVAISGGLLTYLHPFTSILMVPASIAILAERRSARRLIVAGAALLVAVILSLGWVVPLLLTWNVGLPFAHWWQTPETLSGGFAALFRWRLPFPPILLVIGATYGAAQVPLRARFMAAWVVATFAFAVLAYFGSALTLFRNLEPGRFEVAFFAFATPLAALGARDAWVLLGRARPWFRYGGKAINLIALVFFALVSLASLWLETGAHGPIATSLPDQAGEVWGWMRSARDSRIIMESGWARDENGASMSPYFNSDLAMLWAFEGDREVIGGSPSEGFSLFSFADVGNGVAFGQELDSLTPEQFRKQLETYNVGSLIAWSDDTKRYLDRVDGLVALQRSDPYMLYGVAGDHTFLMMGKAATVSASQDCIQIKGAQPGRLVLKYHYFRTLHADSPISISPAPIDNGDPIPFIAIDNDAPRDIRIYNAGFTGWGTGAKACE
jgi:hypothetical protein